MAISPLWCPVLELYEINCNLQTILWSLTDFCENLVEITAVPTINQSIQSINQSSCKDIIELHYAKHIISEQGLPDTSGVG